MTASLSVVMGRWPTPAHENGSAVGPLGRPLLRGGGKRRVDRISDLRVCCGRGSFSTQAYSRDAFMLQERKAASFWVGEGDRGCPLDTGVVPWMWHANGTSRRILADAMSGRLWLPATNLIAKS
jgi:hypothetical protein